VPVCGNNKVSASSLKTLPQAPGLPQAMAVLRTAKPASKAALAAMATQVESARRTLATEKSPTKLQEAVATAQAALARARRAKMSHAALRTLEAKIAEVLAAAKKAGDDLALAEFIQWQAQAVEQDRLARMNLGVARFAASPLVLQEPAPPPTKTARPSKPGVTHQEAMNALAGASSALSPAATLDELLRATKAAQSAVSRAQQNSSLTAKQKVELKNKLSELQRKVAQKKKVAQERSERPGADGRPDHLERRGSLALVKGGGAHIDYKSILGRGRATPSPAFEEAIAGEWTARYRDSTLGDREILSFSVGTFTWVWDATPPRDGAEPENRLIGVYGRSAPPETKRDESRIRGFPSPEKGNKGTTHKGHGVAHSMGGPDEGFNLFGQEASVNIGKRWRALEQYCASRPGTFMFMRASYTNDTDQPTGLEYGVFRDDKTLDVEYFDNF
jgi:hypothetical protein